MTDKEYICVLTTWGKVDPKTVLEWAADTSGTIVKNINTIDFGNKRLTSAKIVGPESNVELFKSIINNV